jgi:hypothetical protein
VGVLDSLYAKIDRLSSTSIRLEGQDVGASTRLKVEGVDW